MTRAGLCATVALLIACGRTVPYGGEPKKPAAPANKRTITTVTSATDLLPADLDLVVRVDLAKVRADLGQEASVEMLNEALDNADVRGAARKTLSEADVVWVGLRIADLEHGDHVLVATRKRKRKQADQPAVLLNPAAAAWTESETNVATITRFVAKRAPNRAGTARIYTIDDTAAVFVSPVEELSVERVLSTGPDPTRGDPVARGLISVDLHAPRLSPRSSKRIPALAKLVAAVTRVRATVDLFGEALELEGTIRCTTETDAAKVERYLATFTIPGTRFADLLAGVQIERTGASVSVRWRVPRALLERLFDKGVPLAAP